MKKQMAHAFLKIGRYAKNQAETEVKKILKHHGVKPAKAKAAAKKIALKGFAMAKELHKIAMTEMRKAMGKARAVKKKK